MITAAEWKNVEESLKSFYHVVKLKCDEYVLTLKLEHISQFENGIGFYVNGEFKGKWLMEDCEERRRFFQPVTRSFMTAKQKAMVKKMSKKRRDQVDEEHKITFYRVYWKSFKALKSHLIRNNQNIELISDGK